MIQKRNWKAIPRHLITSQDLARIEQALVLENPTWRKTMQLAYSTKGIPRWLKLWGEVNGNIMVPREFGNSKFPGTSHYLDRPVEWPTTSWAPRLHQKEPLAKLMEAKEGVLVLPCGFGKSIITLFFLEFLGQRALVLAPTKTVVKQWVTYFDEVFGGDGEARIATSKNWKAAKHLTVASYQQVALHPLPKEFHEQFGVVVYDEVDTANAVQLSKALPKFNCLRVGLTATKEREDKMDVLSDLHIGKVVYKSTKMDASVLPSIYVKDSGLHLPDGPPPVRMITINSLSGQKQEVVMDLVRKAAVKNRKIFVLCERIEQAENYYEAAMDEKLSCSLAHSKIKEGLRDYSKQIIFATNLLGRGFNLEELDTIIITGLFSYSGREFRQVLGRGQRLMKGKKKVIVVIVQDRGPMLRRKLDKVLRAAKELYTDVTYVR